MSDTSVEFTNLDAGSVGLVETQQVTLFADQPLALTSEEETLGPVDVS